MADENNAFRIRKGKLVLEPLATPVLVEEGAIAYDSDDSKLKLRDDVGTKALVTETGVATLTGKTIDADVNTISDLANANIKAGAAIDAAKLADGSVSNAEYQYLGGVTSDIQTQINSKVGAAETVTLTNKTIDGDNNTLLDIGITSLKTDLAAASTFISRDASGVIISTKSVPAGSVVGSSDTQTLTGKTIDADSNTISNIENADIKVGAAIDAAKIANGSVSNTEFQYLDGLTGNIQDQIDDISIPVLPENNVLIGDASNDATAVDTDVVGDIAATVAGGLTIKAGAIVNADVNASAGIDASKLADGSVSNAEFQYLGNVTSDIQAQFAGKVTGPASATDNAAVRFDSTTGKLVQDSVLTISDVGVVAGATQLTVDNLRLDGNTLSSTSGDILLAPATGSAQVGGVEIATASNTLTLTNKSIDGDLNSVTDLSLGVLKNVPTEAGKVIAVDSSGNVNFSPLFLDGNALVINDVNSNLPGNITSLNTGTAGSIRFINAGFTGLSGMNGYDNGKVIYLINATAGSVTVYNEAAGATAVERIVTGTGADLTLAAGAAIVAKYDSTTQRWRVVGGSGSTGTNTGDVTLATFGSSPAAQGASLSGQVLTLQPASATQPGGVSTTTQSFAGAKTLQDALTLSAQFYGAQEDDSTTTGADQTLPTPTKLVKSVSNASLTSIKGITAAASVQQFVFLNKTGSIVTVKNEAGAETATNRILTGTGADITVAVNASLFICRDVTGLRWRVVGGSGSGGATGDVTGPASSTDNALARFDSTTGKIIQNSVAILSDAGALTGVTQMDIDQLRFDNGEISAIGANQDILISPTGTGTVTVNTTLQLGENPAPTVDTSYGAWYTGQDKRPYFKNDAQSQIRLDKTQVINYVLNGDAEGNSTTGWATYADAPGAAPVNGTGGSPFSTWTASSTTPLRGIYDFNFSKAGVDRQGEGVAYDFTIDSADKAKVLEISFDYEILLGYATGDMTVWIYDVTNSQLIQPTPSAIEKIVGPGTWRGTFQTSSTSTSYRLILHVSTTSTAVNLLAFDNFVVGPQIITQGTPVTDWISYTPTISWVSGATGTAKYRRVGDTLEGEAWVLCSGAVTAATLTISLPSGLSIDTTKLTVADAAITAIGYGTAYDAGTREYGISTHYNTTTTVTPRNTESGTGGNAINNATPFTFGNLDSVYCTFSVPILGWSSQVQMSSETSTRVISARVTGGTMTGTVASSIASSTTINWGTATWDSAGMHSAGVFTIPVTGYYKINASALISGTEANDNQVALGVFINGSLDTYQINRVQNSGLTSVPVSYGGVVYCNAGALVTLRASSNITGAAFIVDAQGCFVTIERISGPSQIAASEKIVVSALRATSAQVVNAGATSAVVFNSATVDTSGSFNTSTGRFTAPRAGQYLFSPNLYTTSSTTGTCSLYLYVNGSVSRTTAYQTNTGVTQMTPTFIMNLIQGDYVEVYLSPVTANTTVVSSATVVGGSRFEITSI